MSKNTLNFIFTISHSSSLNKTSFALFRKYYKRYYARTKVNQIKPDKFREWNYKAVEMRDRCQNGEITVQEFEEWLHGSFRNRAKRGK